MYNNKRLGKGAAAVISSLVLVGSGGRASAQLVTAAPSPVVQQQPTPSREEINPAPSGCARLDSLKYPGRENNVFPTACDTIDADAEFRQTLHDYGFLTSFEFRNTFEYDVLGHNNLNPIYTGQNPQEDFALFLEIVYDLSRIGLPKGSLLTVGPELYRDNYKLQGPNTLAVNELAAFIPTLQDRVELQIGWMLWQNVFYGSNLGTSSASSALGPQSSLQTELGEATFVASPGFDIRFWAPGHHLYDHFGLSRSEAPGGAFLDDSSRGPGLEWVVPGTGALFTDEVGYRIPRGRGQHYLWIRAGAIYNNTQFQNFADPRVKVRGNQGFYFTGDYQITTPDYEHYARGLYVNYKVDAAEPDRNLYAEDASLSFYDIGPFNLRPRDVASIGFTYNKFSDYAIEYYRKVTHVKTPNYSDTFIGSYNFHLYKGVFWVNSFSIVKNPTATEHLPNALLWTDAITLLF